MEKEAIESKASEISSWIGDAVSDIAYGAVEFQDAETQKKFRKAKKMASLICKVGMQTNCITM